MTQRVVITGVGVISSMGNDLDCFWNHLINGYSGVSLIEAFDTTDYPTKIAAEIKNFNPTDYDIDRKEARKMDRFVQFAVAASQTALRDAKIVIGNNVDSERIGVIVGSGIGGLGVLETQHTILMQKGPKRVSPFFIPMMIANMASGQVSILTGAKGPNTAVVSACATGAHSVGESFRLIQHGEADVMICGGSEATILPLGMAGFSSMRALSVRNSEPDKASRPFDKQRDGFVMGEGSGVLILESFEHAKARGAKIYAEMIGFGMSADAHHMTDPDPKGGVHSMYNALQDAKVHPQDVDYINAHGTSTDAGDKSETQAIKLVFGNYAQQLAISSTKSMTGHLLGAAGGIEAIILALSIKNDIIPPTINLEQPGEGCDLDYVPNIARFQKVKIGLSNSFGFGGHNATLIMSKCE